MTTNAKRARIRTVLFLWLPKTGTDFTTSCVPATDPVPFGCTRSKCPFRFSFLTEVPQTVHFSVSNATLDYGSSPRKIYRLCCYHEALALRLPLPKGSWSAVYAAYVVSTCERSAERLHE